MAIADTMITGDVTDIRLIYQADIKSNVSGVITYHYHPSGNLNPSESDTRLTQKIKDAGTLIDIQLIDHVMTFQICKVMQILDF